MDPIDSIEGALAATGNRNSVLVVQTSEYKQQRLLNIRRWYIDKRSGEWCPTRKGISVTENAYRFLRTTLNENDTAIQDWFSEAPNMMDLGGAIGSSSQVMTHPIPKNSTLVVRAGDWSGPEMSRMEVLGSKHTMTINERHAVGRAILEVIRNSADESIVDPAVSALLHFLAAFERLPLMFEEHQKWPAGELIDTIRWNIGLTMRGFRNCESVEYEL